MVPLPGGVPDADDTPGAILALHNLAPESADAREAAIAGIAWLADLQNADGGIPTFCRGWGKLPFDRSSPDLTAPPALAWSVWFDKLGRPLRSAIRNATRRALAYLKEAQQLSGLWMPLWFGHQFAERDQNPLTYGCSTRLDQLWEPSCRRRCRRV